MARPKGIAKTGGRKNGSANKATAAARAAVRLFVDGNAHKLQAWLDHIAEGVPANKKTGAKAIPPDPGKAFTLFMSLVQYYVPKLTRTDITSGGKSLPRNVVINVSGK